MGIAWSTGLQTEIELCKYTIDGWNTEPNLIAFNLSSHYKQTKRYNRTRGGMDWIKEFKSESIPVHPIKVPSPD